MSIGPQKNFEPLSYLDQFLLLDFGIIVTRSIPQPYKEPLTWKELCELWQEINRDNE
jgi:hypothetical protein